VTDEFKRSRYFRWIPADEYLQADSALSKLPGALSPWLQLMLFGALSR